MSKNKKVNKKSKERLDVILARIIIFIVIAAIVLVAAFRLGTIGILLNNLFRLLCGEVYLLTVISILVLMFYKLFIYKNNKLTIKLIVGVVLLNLTIYLLASLILTQGKVGLDALGDFSSKYINKDLFKLLISDNKNNFGGGLLGIALYSFVSSLFDQTGTIVLIIALLIISILLIVPLDKLIFAYQKANSSAKVASRVINDKKNAIKEKHRQEKEAMIIAENQRLQMEDRISFVDDDIKDEEKKIVLNPRKNSLFIDIEEVKDDVVVDDISLNKNGLDNNKNEPEDIKPKVLKENRTKNYKLPPISVFNNVTTSKSNNINKTSADLKGKKVIEILENFGIQATLLNTHIGPSVTKFEIKPDSTVKVSKIQNISDNIKMELAARDIRIEAPIPGRNAIGIEIPNVEPIPVRMQELVKMLPQNKKNSKLLFFLGKDLTGKLVICEINKMPHLLIAGATGSGKSVCINSIITSLLYRTKPNEVKLVLVDPKKVEFTPYHDVPHLLWPVITDAQMASLMLKKVVVMMEERFDLFAEVGVRNINSYNEMVDDFNLKNQEPEKVMEHMPNIVIIIDELADLMMVAGKDVEASIQRITQLARASGIHLIVATQRPSTDVITGIIKSNIPSRISFSVASSIDSRTILDQVGAERLLGNGDMLYAPQGENSPIRLQGVYVTDDEVRNITSYCKSLAKPNYDDSYFEFMNINNHSISNIGNRKEKDALYDEVKEYVIEVQKASTSLLQRRFSIGYNRAAGLIEALEENGIVGPTNGSKPREVYIKKEDE